jgi:hypothetical protein
VWLDDSADSRDHAPRSGARVTDLQAGGGGIEAHPLYPFTLEKLLYFIYIILILLIFYNDFPALKRDSG